MRVQLKEPSAERKALDVAQGYDEPFGMLSACHEKVERMLVLLEKLASHLQVKGVDEAARQAARDVLRYFDIAAPLHHEDEELHVLPLLLRSHDAALVTLAQQLHTDHNAMTRAWALLRAELAGLADGTAAELPPTASMWIDFAALYRRHLQVEESLAFPAAQMRIDATGSDTMRIDMMVRRGHPRPGT